MGWQLVGKNNLNITLLLVSCNKNYNLRNQALSELNSTSVPPASLGLQVGWLLLDWTGSLVGFSTVAGHTTTVLLCR